MISSRRIRGPREVIHPLIPRAPSGPHETQTHTKNTKKHRREGPMTVEPPSGGSTSRREAPMMLRIATIKKFFKVFFVFLFLFVCVCVS